MAEGTDGTRLVGAEPDAEQVRLVVAENRGPTELATEAHDLERLRPPVHQISHRDQPIRTSQKGDRGEQIRELVGATLDIAHDERAAAHRPPENRSSTGPPRS